MSGQQFAVKFHYAAYFKLNFTRFFSCLFSCLSFVVPLTNNKAILILSCHPHFCSISSWSIRMEMGCCMHGQKFKTLFSFFVQYLLGTTATLLSFLCFFELVANLSKVRQTSQIRTIVYQDIFLSSVDTLHGFQISGFEKPC